MKVKVICLQDYQQVIPASELVITSYKGAVSTIATPETVITYKAGQKLTFGNKKGAQQFCKAHTGIFQVDIP